MKSMDFSVYLIYLIAPYTWSLLSLRKKWVQLIFHAAEARPVRKAKTSPLYPTVANISTCYEYIKGQNKSERNLSQVVRRRRRGGGAGSRPGQVMCGRYWGRSSPSTSDALRSHSFRQWLHRNHHLSSRTSETGKELPSLTLHRVPLQPEVTK